MRISDWSSDVCSSDLPSALQIPAGTELLPLRMMIADSPGDILNVADGAEIKRAPPGEGLGRVKEHLPQPLVARRGAGSDAGGPFPGRRRGLLIADDPLHAPRERGPFRRWPTRQGHTGTKT